MSLKSSLRITPTVLKYFLHAQPCVRFNARNNVCAFHNLAKSIHVRHLFNDASKTETDDRDGRKRVYNGILAPQIRVVKWFSLTTSVCGIIAQPFIFQELSQMQNIPLIFVACSFVGFFTFVTPLLLHYITRQYITHLDYIPKEEAYVASTVNFFCMMKQIKFTPDDVHVPDIPRMFTTFIAKGQPLFLEARLFEDPSHYVKIMGYDKPMDFKMYETPPKEEK